MRVTSLNLARTIASQLATATSDLIKLQSQIATGRRILTLSDDPVGSVKTMQLVADLGEFEIYKSNLTYSKSYVQTTLTSLDQLLNILSRAQEIAVQNRGSTTSLQIRQSAAVEVKNLFEEIVLLSNVKLGGKYIFGGHDTLNPPFQSDGSYIGDSGELRINIGSNSDLKINMSGDEVFTTGNGGKDIFAAVKALQDALEGGDSQGIGDSIDKIVTAFDSINVKIAESGARLNRIENSRTTLNKFSANTELVISDTVDLDMAQAIIDMAAKQNIINGALATAGRILNLSLVNFL
ncbi:MAG: flagellar hook-associated protein FlgL [Candidatus Marinimicrobia bacterium]|nr:flagellar hook-associated protein FlgL [Candidatus Neomarinimicrobiota bacterium]